MEPVAIYAAYMVGYETSRITLWLHWPEWVISLSCVTQTFQMECPAVVRVGTTGDGQQLIIKKTHHEHNHELSHESFKHLPQQRRLDSDTRKELQEILKLKPNKKLLQQQLSKQSGKVVLLKDLHNLDAATKTRLPDAQTVIEEMKSIKGSTVQVLADSDGMLRAIYFQTQKMKEMYSAFPELILIDATYKLNDLRMPVYVVMVVDGNGESEVVCIWITSSEDQETITDLMNLFKENNPSWPQTKCIMADKDMTERGVLRTTLPDATLQICLFHTLRSFRREISTEKMGITADQRLHALEIVQKLAYAKSVEEYEKHYETLQETQIEPVIKYMNDNWHDIRDEWVDGLKMNVESYKTKTNNRLESFNQKLKSVVTKYSNLVQFFQDLIHCIESLQIERDHRAVTMLQKVQVNVNREHAHTAKYMTLLTPYAFEHVQKHIELSNKLSVTNEQSTDTGGSVQFTSNSGNIEATDSACQCSSWTSMKLPCQHIFAARQKHNLDLYEPELCAVRWTKEYFLRNHRATRQVEHTVPQTTTKVHYSNISSTRVLSGPEKYKRAMQKLQRIAGLVSESCNAEYVDRMNCLDIIELAWANSKTVVVMEASGLSDTDSAIDCDRASVEGVQEQSQSTNAENTETDAATSMPVNQTPNAASNTTVSSSQTVNTDSNAHSDNLYLPIQETDPEFSVPSCPALHLPPRVKKRGRPKGVDLTVVGLPKKRARATKPVPFIRMSAAEKEKLMLSWLVDDNVALAAINGTQIDEELVETRPDHVPMKVVDENVNLKRIQKYFTADAWLCVLQIVKELKKVTDWPCPSCKVTLSSKNMNSKIL